LSRAKKTLTKYKAQLHKIAKKLIEVETLTRDEFEKMFPTPVKKRSGTPLLLVGANSR